MLGDSLNSYRHLFVLKVRKSDTQEAPDQSFIETRRSAPTLCFLYSLRSAKEIPKMSSSEFHCRLDRREEESLTLSAYSPCFLFWTLSMLGAIPRRRWYLGSSCKSPYREASFYSRRIFRADIRFVMRTGSKN